MDQNDIIALISQDEEMMQVLTKVRDLQLPDCYIGAGFVRNMIWNQMSGFKNDLTKGDIDVIYFDKNDFSQEEGLMESTPKEIAYQEKLKHLFPLLDWSVTNQARMHAKHGHLAYENTYNALSYWVETATCIAVRLTDANTLKLIAPWGIEDLVNMKIVISPSRKIDKKTYMDRIEKKKWKQRWPKVEVVLP